MTWATSPQYLKLAGKTSGWANVPPGTRYSIYHDSQYLKAAPFAPITLKSIDNCHVNCPFFGYGFLLTNCRELTK